MEATADLGMLVQSLRTEQYHTTLFEQMDLTRSAQTVSRMLDRLERSAAAELRSVVSHERRADRSLFDSRYTWIYLLIGAVLAVSALVVAAHYLRQWLKSRPRMNR